MLTEEKSKPSTRIFIDRIKSLVAFIRYNATIVFAGKSIYFLILAIVLLLAVSIFYVLNNDAPPGAQAVYYFLLVPGVLLIFYPSAYSIQNDVDSRMIETLFGIPDYRYKIWLARSLTHYLAVAVLLLLLAVLCRLGLATFSLNSMLFHLMFPVVFLGSLGFMTAVLTRSGNSTAVVMVAVVLFFWFTAESLEGSPWNLFHNPFADVEQIETFLLSETTLYNRIYLFVGSVIATMFGLLRLQQREKFI
jgi:hypothetical protein